MPNTDMHSAQVHLTRKIIKRKIKSKAYSTWGSKAVAQPSTSQARRGLTSVIGREPVLSAWYGRKPKATCKFGLRMCKRHIDDSLFENPCRCPVFLIISPG